MFRPNVPPAPAWFMRRYTDKEQAMQRDDQVQHPKHYEVFPGVEAIEVMARSATVAEWRGFCKLTVLKYRLRSGKKGVGTAHQDLAKGDEYIALYEQHKHLCSDFITQTYTPRKNDQ